MMRVLGLLIIFAMGACTSVAGCAVVRHGYIGAASRDDARYCCGVCPGASLEAIERCPIELAVGPAAGIVGGTRAPVSPQVGLDATLGRPPFWGGVGARVDSRFDGAGVFTYAEGGLAIGFVTLGVGGGARFGSTPVRVGPHLFVGAPIPATVHWYLEPYYRPSFWFDVPGGEFGTVHEVGLLVKYWTHRADYED